MPPTRLSIAKRDIVKAFEETPTRVFTRADIDEIISRNRTFWRLSQSTTTNKFIAFLLDRTPLKAIEFEFPARPTTRYVWGDVPTLQVVQCLNQEAYFSHYTAVDLHELTEQIPKTIYLNIEQRLTGSGGELTQDRIERAFKLKPRVSHNVAPIGDLRICLLNGRNTGRLGVVEISRRDLGQLRVTGVERTLIDIAVRPVYAGGVFEVAKAYKLAQNQLSVNKLVAYLKKLKYTYPYHQAIGFYLDRAGVYKESQINLLHELPMHFDFYLANRMGKVEYIKKWRLFVPKGF